MYARSALCSEEEAALSELLGLVLHGCQVAGERSAGGHLAVVGPRRVEAIDGGPDGEYIVHNGVNS